MPNLIVINWSVGILGAVGIVGAIALAIFVPAVFATLARLVGDFLSTRLGLAIAVGAACLYGGLVYGDISGRGEERAKCQAAQLAAEMEAKARDARQGQLASEDEAQRLAALQAQVQQDQETLDAYAKALAGGKSAACVLTPADLPQRR